MLNRGEKAVGVNISYKLIGSGWAECVLNVDGQMITTTASYLSHALESLLRGAIDILRADQVAKASFDEEPGEYRWIFTRIDERQINVKILWFDELWNAEPDERGRIVFDANCRLRTFAVAILSASQQVLSDNGYDGYKNKWGQHDFPLTAQNELKQLLAETRQPKNQDKH